MKRLMAFILLLPLVVVLPTATAQAAVQRVQFTAGGNYLVVEFLDDDLVHFEMGAGGGPGTGSPIFTTTQVAKTNYPGPTSLNQAGGVLTTPGIKVDVNTSTLCATVYDTTRTPQLLLNTTARAISAKLGRG